MREKTEGTGGSLHDYAAFVAVVDAGNLTRGAERLDRSLQSVSRSLAALERELGVVLVRRTTRRAQPTEMGVAFYRRLKTALREIAQAESDLRETSSTLSGPLRIAGSSLFVAKYVVPAIRDFSALHPAVRFDLRLSERFTEPIRSGADLTIRIGESSESSLRSRKLGSIRRVVVASSSYIAEHGRPEIPADLAHHACLLRSSSQDQKGWTFRAKDGTRVHVPVRGSFESDSLLVINQAMIAGLGIAIAHAWLIREALETGLVEVLLDDFTIPSLPVHALWPPAPRVPARVKRFVDLLAQRLKKEIF